MVAPAPDIARATSADFDALLALLDAEFIFGKGRRVSLQQRFPETLDRAHSRNIMLARMEEAIVSALVTRPFTWITSQRSWRAAMIGMVTTRAEWRGRGMAGALMRAARETLAREGVEFLVLWAARPDFYAGLGWMAADCGALGSVQTAAPDATQSAAPFDAASIAWIEALRREYAPERVERCEISYAALLPHAEQLELLRSGSAYAIAGRDDRHGYLYELLGDAAEFPVLWARLARRYRALYLNLQRGTAAERYLSSRGEISWQPQRLALWLPLSETARAARFAGWYVPFLDRI